MTNKHIQTTFPYDQIVESGYPSPAFEQFLRALHIRTGNKAGIDIAEVQQTAQDALQTGVNAQAIADLAMMSLFTVDQNVQNSNQSMQGVYASSLANESLILGLLSQIGESIALMNQTISQIQEDIANLKGNS